MKAAKDRQEPEREKSPTSVSREPGAARPTGAAPREPEPRASETPLFRVQPAHPEELDESGAH